jgi:hypothetical protein
MGQGLAGETLGCRRRNYPSLRVRDDSLNRPATPDYLLVGHQEATPQT